MVALSMDIEPESLPVDWRPADYSDPFDECPTEFKNRLKIAIAHLKAGSLPHKALAWTNLPRSGVSWLATVWAGGHEDWCAGATPQGDISVRL